MYPSTIFILFNVVRFTFYLNDLVLSRQDDVILFVCSDVINTNHASCVINVEASTRGKVDAVHQTLKRGVHAAKSNSDVKQGLLLFGVKN